MIVLKNIMKDLEDGSYGFTQLIHPETQEVLAEIESDVLCDLLEGEVNSMLSESDWQAPIVCAITTKRLYELTTATITTECIVPEPARSVGLGAVG